MFCLLPKHEEGVAMNRLLLLALVSFVLAVGMALPYSDYEEPSNDEMEEVSNDFKAREAETLSDLDWNDEKYFPHGKEDDEEDGDDDDYYEDEEDENDEEDDNNPLTNPLKKSSDPFIRFRKIFRRFRRRIFGR